METMKCYIDIEDGDDRSNFNSIKEIGKTSLPVRVVPLRLELFTYLFILSMCLSLNMDLHALCD